MPGVPFIYYGDEIGMKYIESLPSKEGGYNRTGSRTPMQWSNGRNAGFSEATANKLYLPVDRSKNSANVESQQDKPYSLLNKVRRLIALRKSSAALCADGEFIPLYAKPRKYPFVYMRRKGREKFLITLNPSSNKVSANFKAPSISSPGRLQVGTGTVLTAKDGRSKVDMAPVSYGIFRM
jgi:maltose alpha-D-glucosyltransferase/alpha-amylase